MKSLKMNIRILLFILLPVWIALPGMVGMEPTRPDMDQEMESRLVKIATKWKLLIRSRLYNESSENDNHRITWTPTIGIRGKYLYLKKVINRKVLEAMTGHKVFVKGPHDDEPNFTSRTSFGYYNPECLRTIKNILQRLSTNPQFIKVFENYYHEQLKTLVRTFLKTYNSKNINEKLIEEYLISVRDAAPDDDAGDPAEVLYKVFYTEANAHENNGYVFFEYATCCGFWVRRKIDQTDKIFLEIFTLVAEKFDPEFLKTPGI